MVSHRSSDEKTSLLRNGEKGVDKKENSFLLPITLQIIGALVCVGIGMVLASSNPDMSLRSGASLIPLAPGLPLPPSSNALASKYTHFQALNYQIYTGGAPVKFTNTSIHNDECSRDHKHHGTSDGTDYCYLGHDDVRKDVNDRLAIMKEAVEKAYDESSKDLNTLKVFVAPEFFFRGRNGAYRLSPESQFVFLDKDGRCEAEICEILMGLEDIVADKRFEDWLFLMGTTIVSENLPTEDQYDYLFYNFAILLKGYDPATDTHVGKRFLVPKRYVSGIDFLTPNRFGIKNETREIYETALSQQEDANRMVLNPHDLEHSNYDHNLWYKYKHELVNLDYIMIEYGWFEIDGITFSVEICLDHDLRSAMTAFLADAALPEPTLIPSSRDGLVEYIEIPKHQAQLSLVSSAGMTASATSMVLTNQGSIILQDGLEGNQEASMEWEYECFKYEWGFGGGSEVITRTASVTPTEVVFHYNMHYDYIKHPIYDGNWQEHLRGVFSTVMYEPKMVVYEPAPIATTYQE